MCSPVGKAKNIEVWPLWVMEGLSGNIHTRLAPGLALRNGSVNVCSLLLTPFSVLAKERVLALIFHCWCLPSTDPTACFSQEAKPIISNSSTLKTRGQFAQYTVYLFSMLQSLWCIFLRQLICSWIHLFAYWLPISLAVILRLAGTCGGFLTEWKEVVNKPRHRWLCGAIWWATNAFIWQLHALIRYSLGNGRYKYGDREFGEPLQSFPTGTAALSVCAISLQVSASSHSVEFCL